MSAQAGAGAGISAFPVEEPSERTRRAAIIRRVDAWVEDIVTSTVRRHSERPPHPAIAAEGGSEHVDAAAIIRRACIRTAIAGATTGAISTGASVATAETQGLAGLVVIPAAALSVGAETLLRLREHVRMTCEIADSFGLRFDPDDPSDVWALLSLTFVDRRGKQRVSPGESLRGFATIKSGMVTNRLAANLLGEGVARNLVPFLDIASSSITNWVITRRLGDIVRRYARYRRAFDDTLDSDELLRRHIELLVAGVWFLFIADGPPTPEETALMAALLRRCEQPFLTRLDDALADDIEWVGRLREIPEPARMSFYYALEVAAAVDKHVSVRERKLLAHAARALGIQVDPRRVDRMVEELEDVGVLRRERPPREGGEQPHEAAAC